MVNTKKVFFNLNMIKRVIMMVFNSGEIISVLNLKSYGKSMNRYKMNRDENTVTNNRAMTIIV